ncbi:hypothetical protein OIE66_19010 [Nonomuraea sp. NBC_01738]|uniref:YncE family protein n=1 Tax=Nonomuraea sp. NBC_01738 TaxID=2976003 RepID=UPI002E1485A4|nr:hypothetical protein OIE66_19010 [Nonomuraea sp. NBC_01738]
MRTTRREVLGGALAFAVLAGCRREPVAATRAAGRLFAETTGGMVAVDLAGGVVERRFGDAVPDGRWRRMHEVDGGELKVRAVTTGEVVGQWVLRGVSRIKAISRSGDVVAVGPPPGPRRSTPLSLAGPGGVRGLRLDGNIEPEAFSSDGQVMYVLDYLPPTAPDRYRVRMLDLADGRLYPLLTRDKKVVPEGKEEEMRGRGRQAVLDAGRGVLYTLYTHQPDHLHTRDLIAGHDDEPDVHAFVHVLNLEQRWAYCLDLPQPFGLGPPDGHTLALDPAGGTLYVHNATSGRVVRADTQDLTIKQSTIVPVRPGTRAYALAGEERLYLAAGQGIQVLDGPTLAPRGAWPLPGAARGLAAIRGEVLAGAGERVVRLDATTGAPHGSLTLPGLLAVRHATNPA